MAGKTTETFEEKLNGFFSSNLKTIIIAGIAVVLIAFGYVCISSVMSKSANKDISEISKLELSVNLEDQTSVNDTLEAIEAYKNKSGIAGVRANLLSAEIKFAKSNFAEAANDYVKAGDADKSAYTAPVAYFNAAVCYESLETPDFENAVKYYAKAADYKDYPKIDHALFSLGRANEAKGDIEAAKKAYSKLVERADTFADLNPTEKPIVEGWINIAKSRLIEFETN